jgi:hypothetical protein
MTHPGSFLSNTQIDGLPETASPILSLQLSSPIEEISLTQVFDPLDPTAEGSVACFKGVETAQAILSVVAFDADIPLGTSESLDVAPLCLFDPMDVKDKYVQEMPVAIIADESNNNTSTDISSEEEPTVIQPVCTITFRVTYKPSTKDQMEELNVLLGKLTSKRKVAMNDIRQLATSAAQAKSPGVSSGGAGTVIKSGFLNQKIPEKNEESKVMQLYTKGVRQLKTAATYFMTMKNYAFFFGAVGALHFFGQELALPPPV